ncbi:Uncharacterised protein [BD1-7 clade bacterium]|uniref:Fatty acid hydroxylase domain-containing protein n=1 Tax=BD1-7 clade bacterium TaxID=2029982 RepID=A0A5S9N0H9_9GAMM|nr:Uncharacterised protein [BD1-7 clade bacterium]CAA0083098.1 Uncharacterised protein [BD1-7 clade bacterium]
MTDTVIRLSIFFGILVIMLIWEQWAGLRQPAEPLLRRRFANISFSVINSMLVRLFWPAGLSIIALWAESQQLGLFNAVQWPFWIECLLAIVILDCLIYWQHRLFHRIPALWRIHRMHHSDLDFDVTTALRFHPLEILLSMVIKTAAVIALGLPPFTIVLFEIILNGLAMFNHGNVQLPKRLDNLLRQVIVTPDMHRVHHSVVWHESNSNFGFNLSIWDRLFHSYEAQPAAGHLQMDIGLDHYPKLRARGLIQPLCIPWYSAEKNADTTKTSD